MNTAQKEYIKDEELQEYKRFNCDGCNLISESEKYLEKHITQCKSYIERRRKGLDKKRIITKLIKDPDEMDKFSTDYDLINIEEYKNNIVLMGIIHEKV